MKDDRLYLRHILSCIADIEAYVGEHGEEAVRIPGLVQDAVLRKLQIMAESAKLVTKETQERMPDVPWRTIVAFRHVLVHQYLGVDTDRILGVVTRRLPELKQHAQLFCEENYGKL